MGATGVLPCAGRLIRISGGRGTSPCATSSVRVPCLPFSLMAAHLSGFVKATQASGFACITPLLIHAPYCQFTKRKRQSHRPSRSSKLYSILQGLMLAGLFTVHQTEWQQRQCFFGRNCDYNRCILLKHLTLTSQHLKHNWHSGRENRGTLENLWLQTKAEITTENL